MCRSQSVKERRADPIASTRTATGIVTGPAEGSSRGSETWRPPGAVEGSPGRVPESVGEAASKTPKAHSASRSVATKRATRTTAVLTSGNLPRPARASAPGRAPGSRAVDSARGRPAALPPYDARGGLRPRLGPPRRRPGDGGRVRGPPLLRGGDPRPRPRVEGVP